MGGLVAVSSKLGWLLSGLFYNEKETISMHLDAMTLVTRMMFISFNENKTETNKLDRAG